MLTCTHPPSLHLQLCIVHHVGIIYSKVLKTKKMKVCIRRCRVKDRKPQLEWEGKRRRPDLYLKPAKQQKSTYLAHTCLRETELKCQSFISDTVGNKCVESFMMIWLKKIYRKLWWKPATVEKWKSFTSDLIRSNRIRVFALTPNLSPKLKKLSFNRCVEPTTFI